VRPFDAGHIAALRWRPVFISLAVVWARR